MDTNGSELSAIVLASNVTVRQYFVRDVLFITGLNVTALLAVISNYFVLKVISSDSQMRSKTYALIANMALSDLMAGVFLWCEFIFCSHLFMETSVNSKYVCSASQTSLLMTYFVSTFTMTAIAVDRHRGIVTKPLHSHDNTIAIKVCSWIFGTVLNLPVLTGNSIPEFFAPKELLTFRVVHKSTYNRLILQIRSVIVFMCQFGIPLIITTYCYARILVLVKNRKIIGHHEPHRRVEFQRRNYRIVKMLIVIMICFTIAWFPIHLSHIYVIFSSAVFDEDPEIPSAFLFLYWLALSSCCFNPFIYLWYYKEFRTQLRNTTTRLKQSLPISFKSKTSSTKSTTRTTENVEI